MSVAHDTKTSLAAGTRPKAFISYSRKDLPFVDQLTAALEARGIDTQRDRDDIPVATPWRPELADMIRRSDSFVCVLSPASVASAEVIKEIEEAVRLGKRLAPVVISEVDQANVHEALRAVNYAFVTGPEASGAGFESKADTLVQSLLTDLPWVKEHTRLGLLAARWAERKKSSALLLRGSELETAEVWRAKQVRESPGLTPLHREFIAASRSAATRRMRTWIGLALAALVVTAGLGSYAWVKKLEVEAENLRFEKFFDVVSKESTLRVEDVSAVEDEVAIAKRVVTAGRNLARRDSSGVRILWVDDDPDNNVEDKKHIKETMQRFGVEFVSASSVEAAKASLLSDAPFDLVISDLKHNADPEGTRLAGLRILDHLKAEGAGRPIPLIIYATVFDREQADRAKCEGVVAEARSRATMFAWILIALDEGRDYRPSREIRALCSGKDVLDVGP